MATPNGTQFQVATDSGFTTKLIDYSSTYEASHSVPTKSLTRGVQLYARVRHSSVETGYGSWSPTRQFSIAQYNRYFKVFGSTMGIFVRSSQTDSVGNTYTICSMSIPDTNNTSGYKIAVVIIKHDYSGTLLWCKQYYQTNQYDLPAMASAIDSSDNLYVTCDAYYGYIESNYMGFIMKINGSGTLQWYNSLGTATNGNLVSFSSANMVVFGAFVYVVGFATTSISTIPFSGLIVKFNTTGGPIVWQKKFLPVWGGNTYRTLILGLDVDTSGNIYISGSTYYDNTYTNIGYVMKLNSDGTILWYNNITSAQAAPNNHVSTSHVQVGTDSYVYIKGEIGTSTYAGSKMWVLCLSASTGAMVWGRALPQVYGFSSGSWLRYLKLNKVTNVLYMSGREYISSGGYMRGLLLGMSTTSIGTIVFSHALKRTNDSGSTFMGKLNILPTGELHFGGYGRTSEDTKTNSFSGPLPPNGDIGVYGPILNITTLQWMAYPITVAASPVTVGAATMSALGASTLAQNSGSIAAASVTLSTDTLNYY